MINFKLCSRYIDFRDDLTFLTHLVYIFLRSKQSNHYSGDYFRLAEQYKLCHQLSCIMNILEMKKSNF